MRSLHLTFILSLILLNSAGLASADQRLSAWLGSSYVLPGEESEFWLTLTSETRPLEKPKTPDSKSIVHQFALKLSKRFGVLAGKLIQAEKTRLSAYQA